MARAKYTYAQTACIKKAGLAMQRTAALWPGCRIGVAVSGGEDSFTLLQTLIIRRKIVPFDFELMVLHCNPGYDVGSHRELLPWLARAGLAGHVEVGAYGPKIMAGGEKGACFACARERRRRLFELCAKYGLTHLAIGHNADDLLATFLLNFCQNGRVAGMSLAEDFFGGSLRVIRPLLLVEKKTIHQAARQWRLPVWKNACPLSGKTARTRMEHVTEAIGGVIGGARRSMLNALMRWQLAQNTPEAAAGEKPLS